MSNFIADQRNGAVNPYNFVSLGNGVERKAHNNNDNDNCNGNISGVIHCSLTNATPIALPDMPLCKTETVFNNGKKEEHKKAPFFKADGKPVIAGSEIRGVIRSAYETLSNSCFSVNNNNTLSARSADVRSPGVLRYETGDKKWHLYQADAKRLKYDGSDDFDETSDTFKRTWLNKRYEKGKPVSNKKIPVSYKFSTSFEEVMAEELDLAVEDYNTVCDIYVKNDTKTFDPRIKDYIIKPKKDGKCYPVYYKFVDERENYVWLSPAQISRSVFRKKVDDLLDSYSHCTDTHNVCEACNLFGMIGKECEPSAIASRLRFTDAVLCGNAKLAYKTLKELASPHISSVEFYSTAPNMKKMWNYDTRGVSLNGRKYYFHHCGDCTTDEKTGRNLTAELIEKGAKFSFDIFFDSLTEKELSRLVWTLAIGENKPDGHQMHKLGHGKPLGLGSVKITVDSVEKRSFDSEKMTFADEKLNVETFFENVPFDENETYFKEYMAITDFNYLGGSKVAYPYGDDCKGQKTSAGTLTWFKANHNDGKPINAGDTCFVTYHLPKITDKNRLVLPALIKNSGGQGGNNYSKSKSYNSGSEPKGQMSYAPQKSGPTYAEVQCPACKKKMKKEKNKIATRVTVECEYCHKKFKASY